ncbi:Rpn family recombination-promoting nuclease/putative transposase [Treponema sp. OMZ 840]
MIRTVKQNEQARQEYRFMSAFEMDAREEGIQQGIEQGTYQKAFETAKNLLAMNLPIENIAQATGLSIEEVKAL